LERYYISNLTNKSNKHALKERVEPAI